MTQDEAHLYKSCATLLLQRLRENALCSYGGPRAIFGSICSDDEEGNVAIAKEKLLNAAWFKSYKTPSGRPPPGWPSYSIAAALVEARRWKPFNENERNSLSDALRRAVKGGHLEMAEWLLDEWGVDPRWQGEFIGDYAIGPDILHQYDHSLRKERWTQI